MGFIAAELSSDTYVDIMAQYYPAHKANEYRELERRITRKEFEAAVTAAREAGLTNIRTF